MYRRLNAGNRERAVQLMLDGHSAAAAARIIGCDYRTVMRWWQRYNDDAGVEDAPRAGRPPGLSEVDSRRIVEYATANQFCTAGQIREALNLQCETVSIYRRLNEAGLFGRVAASKSLLSEANMRVREAFGRQQLDAHPDVAFWRRVVFSDEKTFCTSRHGRLIVYRRRGNAARYAPRNVGTRQQSGRCTVHVWGWMDGEGRGALYRTGRTTAASYRDLLEDQFLPDYDLLRPDRQDIVFQQDNATVHTARLVRQWMEGQPRLEVLPWAARSPDINPIENVWGVMTSDLTPTLNGANVTADQLWELVQEAWWRVTPALCRRLADSVPERLQEVVDNGGAWSHY